MLYKYPQHFCAHCTKQNLSKSEDENKAKTFFSCMFSKFIWWKINRQGNEKHISLRLYNLNNFLLSSHPFLSCFCLFFGNIFKVKSSFWYYDLSTSPVFCFKYKKWYTFLLYSHIRIGYINFWSVSYHSCHQILETKNKDWNKKSLVDSFLLSFF